MSLEKPTREGGQGGGTDEALRGTWGNGGIHVRKQSLQANRLENSLDAAWGERRTNV